MPTGMVIFSEKDKLPLVLVFLRIETEPALPLLALDMARSVLPSPSKSPAAIPNGSASRGRSCFAAREMFLMGLVFLNTDAVAELWLVIKRSGFPSPSKSAIAMLLGYQSNV